jgi:5-methylcytosine-specific restriction endonuclease McrA
MPAGKTKEEYNAYMAKYMRERIARRRAEAIKQLGGKCVRCGTTENLEFDHIDRTTKDPRCGSRNGLRGTMWTFSEKRLQAELEKCQLLCKDCHWEKTLEDLGRTSAKGTHGTLSAYRYCGPPKCEECKAVKREYMQSYEYPTRSRS